MRLAVRPLAIAIASVMFCGCAPDPVHTMPERAEVGQSPTGFTQALTGGGGPVAWAVRADDTAPGTGQVIVQESRDETSYRFPMCIRDGIEPADVSTEVKFKTISGTVDQAAGLVLRYRPENYYVARANALEDNVNLFRTVNGNRIKIAEVNAKVAPGQWHTLGFIAKGNHLTVTFNGTPLIEADDATFNNAGQVGLWTKADSVTAFTDLHVQPAR